MNCNHKYVSVGTKRFCFKCGHIFGTEEENHAKEQVVGEVKKPRKTKKKEVQENE